MIARLRGLSSATPGAQALIQAAAAKYGVDPNLALAVANQESGLNQSAKSSAGAIGIMQLMPATAAGLGVDPTDAAQNVDGGVKLLSQLLTQYNGDTSLALAAYNAGPGNVAKYGGIPPFPETQNYVASILSAVGQNSPDSGATDSSSPSDGSIPVDSSGNPIASSGGDSVATVGLLAAAGLAAAYLLS
jgi:soluble lytic murein transglycosylase-like protein